MPAQRTRQGRNWCYTLNNYTAEEIEYLQGLDCKYHLYGKEVGESGTPHLQGFIVFAANKRFNAVVNLLPVRCHVDLCGGSASENIVYCKKDGDFWEFGDAPLTQLEKGAKNAQRYIDAFAAAKEGRFDDIPADMRIRHYNTFKSIAKDYAVPPQSLDNMPGIWIYGSAGAGKSRKARDDYPGAFIKKADNKWFDSYQGQDVMIVDDFDKFMVAQAHNLKIWGDRYAFPAETKGGTLLIRPKKVVVTSQYHPYEIWDDHQTRDAIGRRYMLVYMLNGHCVVDAKVYV